MSEASTNKPSLIAYTVSGSDEKSYFNRVGAAWPNSKGGFQVRLFATPINGEIVLLPPKERVPAEPAED
ncbi:hypothetical protein [Sedimenticola thiotaurini]|uniref:hypothetical protein n=1 Tax=Sedimenticola thiotaurini TaxID=1543721 RepID=UPI0009E4B484|nr:hypothetical protein [Sedimenticola thiotaurini]